MTWDGLRQAQPCPPATPGCTLPGVPTLPTPSAAGQTVHEPSPGTQFGKGWLAGLALVLVFAVAVRLAGASQAMYSAPFIPPESDGDAAYHLIRMMRFAEAFPSMPLFDPGLNWPEGGVAPWAPGFDWLGALLIVIGGGAGSGSAPAVAAMLPVLMAGVILIGVSVLPSLVRPGPEAPWVGLYAAALLAGAPEFVRFSEYGRTDHHVAEVLIIVSVMGWAATTSTVQGRRAFELAGFAAVAFACFVYQVGTIYVGLAVAVVITLSALRARQEGTLRAYGAPALAAATLFTFVLYRPFVALTGAPLDILYPSYLHPLLLALGAAGCALAPVLGVSVRARWAASVGLAVLTALVVGTFGAELRDMFLQPEPWLASIGEAAPFNPLAVWSSPRAAFDRFGVLGPVLPIVLLLGPVVLYRAEPRAPEAGLQRATRLAIVLGFWTLVIAVLCFSQGRFTRLLVANVAISGGILVAALVSRIRAPGLRRALGLTLTLGIALASEGPTAMAPPVPFDADAEVGTFLASASMAPATGPGVLSWWDRGHMIEWTSGKPTVVGGFGPEVGGDTLPNAFEALYAEDASVTRAFMESRRAGWLVLGLADFQKPVAGHTDVAFVRLPDGTFAPSVPFMRDHPMARTMVGGSGYPGGDVPHLEGFMPVFASRQVSPGTAFHLPALWVYELVRGAIVSGVATPGSTVEASIDIDLRGLRVPYRASVDADAGGRFTFSLPVPSGMISGPLSTGPAWTMRVDGQPLPVVIPIEAVREGRRIGL